MIYTYKVFDGDIEVNGFTEYTDALECFYLVCAQSKGYIRLKHIDGYTITSRKAYN